MKKIIYSLMLIGSIFGLTGCHDVTTEDKSDITYYVAFEMLGDPLMLVTVGTSYDEPGVIATEKGVDVTSSVQIGGDVVDPNTIGLYKVVYSGTNVDGFTTSTERTVIVCNPAITTDISGNYKTISGTHRKNLNTNAVVNYAGYPIVITKIAPGFFSISDFFGGYYHPRLSATNPNYNSTSVMYGFVQLNSDNSLGLLTSHTDYWGDSLDGMINGKYDPVAGTVYWEALYADNVLSFNVLLKK